MSVRDVRFPFLILFSFIALHISATDIGSDTAVTRFNTEQTVNSGDRIAGFAALEGGFQLADASVFGTYDSFFPVSGTSGLRGGDLILDQDLWLRNTFALQTLGTIVGNNHVIGLTGPATLPSAICPFVFLTSLDVSATNFSSDWSFDDAYVAIGVQLGGLSGVNIYSFDGSTLTFVISNFPGGGNVTVNAVRWHPSSLLLALARNQNGTSEINVFSFVPGGPSLTSESSDNIATGDYTACSWHPSGDFLAVGGTENGSELKIYPVSAAGILDTAGVLTVGISPNRDVQRAALDWDLTGSFLAVGVEHLGASDADLLVYQFSPEPSLDLILNAEVEIGFSVLSVDWNSTTSETLAIGLAAGASEQVEAYRFDNGDGTLLDGSLTLLTGIDDLDLTAVQSVDWSPNGDCLAVGRNIFSGSGSIRSYEFDSTQNIFTLQNAIDASDDVTSARYSHNGNYLVTSEDIVPVPLTVYSVLDLSNTQFIWSDLNIMLGGNTILRDCLITFTGENVISGRGSTLTLESDCTILLGTDSALRFEDMTLKGVSGTQIQAIDDSGTFTFNNVYMILDEDYTFSQGAFDVFNEFTIAGNDYSFSYETDQVSTITRSGALILEEGVTFHYAPPTATQQLLVMADDTASLWLKGATLSSDSTGMQLTKGNFFIEGSSFISNGGSILAEAIMFGDGSSAASNITMEWLPAAELSVQQGFFRDANI